MWLQKARGTFFPQPTQETFASTGTLQLQRDLEKRPSTVPTRAKGLGAIVSCFIPISLCSDAERRLGSLNGPLRAESTS